MTDAPFGRQIQSRIYTAGVFCHRPSVPTHPESLDRAAVKATFTRLCPPAPQRCASAVGE